ncbi:MAG: Crp/Fnr family transcriptional regulator [Pseudomonadales bacterium]|jgi:CRP-like cAMP-binding protein|nr:Crp/Fnr family transcriptional regulator [Pseudomonadales bacterium]
MRSKTIERVELDHTVLDMMRSCVLLQPLSDEQFMQVVQTAHAWQLPKGCVLFHQGAALTDIYLLISGGVKLQRLAPSGDQKVLEIIRPRQTFAEGVLFSGGSKYPVTSVAVSKSVVVGIQAKNYLQLLNGSNELCIALLGKISQRLHWMVSEMDRLTLHNANFRLISYLLSDIPEEDNSSTEFSLAAPKHVIASRLSIKPETLSRTLKVLSEQGLIKLKGSKITLMNVEKLRELIRIET